MASVFRRLIGTVAALAVTTLLSAPVLAQTTIKVVVNDKPITSYNVAQRARLIQLTTRRGGAAAQREAMEELIDEVLKLQETQRLGISVSKAEVDNAFASIAQRVKLSPANLSRALQQSGVNPDTLRDRLRAEIGWSQAVRMRFRASVKINDSDVIAAMRRAAAKEEDKGPPISIEYAVQSIVFVVPAKASGSFKAQRRREVDQFRARMTSCADAAKMAEGMKEVVLLPERRRLETEVPEDIRKELEAIGVGKATKPTETDRGLEIIALCDKRELQSDIAARVEMESELRNKEGEQLARRYLQDLRRRAVIDYR